VRQAGRRRRRHVDTVLTSGILELLVLTSGVEAILSKNTTSPRNVKGDDMEKIKI
jgi:hypothetical protein